MRDKLIEIAKLFVPDNQELTEKEMLNSIIGDSQQAISFVSVIEDEFQLEFQDDDIDLDFFSSFDNIIRAINKNLS